MISVFSSLNTEYFKIAASFVAGSAAVRAWFAKEIAKGKAELDKVEAEAKSVEQKVVAEVKKL